MTKTRHTLLGLSLCSALGGACAVEPTDDEITPEPAPEAAATDELDEVPDCALLDHVQIRDGFVVLQDDMVLGTEDELDALCEAYARPGARSVRIDGADMRWPNGVIPYYVDPELPDKHRVQDAINHWHDETSLQFVPYVGQGDYIEFTNGDACQAQLGRQGGKQYVWLSTGKSFDEIRGMAIASNDWVYTWYADGMVSAGSSVDLDSNRAQYKYTLPPGYTTAHIVEMAIAADDRVYTWYTNGKVSVGTTSDLDAHEAPHGNYAIPGGRTPAQIVGIGIGSGDKVYAWYSDGTRSVGTSQNLAAHLPAQSFADHADHPIGTIRGIDIASTDKVYTWYGASGSLRLTIGQSRDLAMHQGPTEYKLPKPCGTGAAIHEIGHAVGLWHEQGRCDRDEHVDVFYENIEEANAYNFDKMCVGYTDHGAYDTNSVMHYSSYSFSKNDRPTLLAHGALGVGPPSGLYAIDSAIAGDDRVYTWWSDGTVTAGTTSNLEYHRSRYPYTLAPGYKWWDVRGIAIAKSTDKVYVFYGDGKVSVGTTDDLDAYQAPYSYALPGGRHPSQIVAIGISSIDRVYAWYSDGTASSGTSDNLGAHDPSYGYVVESGFAISDVIAIDISSSDTIYAWYDNGKVSKGTSWNLGSDGSPYSYRARGLVVTSKSVLSQGDIDNVEAMY